MAPGLLGPPEHQSTIATPINTNQSPPSITQITTPYDQAFQSTGNPCLDFFHVVPETPSSELTQCLQHAWQSAPLTSLKLICNLRGVRGTGKNDKEGFYNSALWLHKNHPKTLALNVGAIAQFGSLKDLLEILFRILEGPEVRKRMKEEWEKKKPEFFAYNGGKKRKVSESDKEKSKSLRAEKKAAKAKKALERYTYDPEYKFLYDRVSDVFAELLRRDVKLLQVGDMESISLAAKWCPSLDSSYDEALLICESIGKKVFPRDEYVEFEGIEEAHYAYRVRTRLRKEVLVPLRKALEVPEVYMCAKRWRSIAYDKVPSQAMKLGKKVFLKHDKIGFEEFLEEVRDGESEITAGALLPHEIVAGLSDRNPNLVQVAELQWKKMVNMLAKQGKLTNCIATCNNVDSDVCVALMIFVSELSGEPWKGKVLTSGECSKVYKIEGDELVSKVKSIRDMQCYFGMILDLELVFDEILDLATEQNLGEDQMIRRLFVFSDEESEQVWIHSWETKYAEIQRKFLEKGFQKAPEVVLWNLKDSRVMPLRCDQPGMAIVSGFSKNLLTLFMEEGGVLSPETVMYAAISRASTRRIQLLEIQFKGRQANMVVFRMASEVRGRA